MSDGSMTELEACKIINAALERDRLALKAENKRLRDALAHYATDETPEGWIAIEALAMEVNDE